MFKPKLYLKFWHSLVEEVGQVCSDGQQYRLGRNLIIVLPVPLLQETGVVAHSLEDLNELGQLLRVNLRGNGSVAILLGAKVDKVWTHGVFLTSPQLVHTQGRGHVFIGHLIPYTPPHVHNLKFKCLVHYDI